MERILTLIHGQPPVVTSYFLLLEYHTLWSVGTHNTCLKGKHLLNVTKQNK